MLFLYCWNHIFSNVASVIRLGRKIMITFQIHIFLSNDTMSSHMILIHKSLLPSNHCVRIFIKAISPSLDSHVNSDFLFHINSKIPRRVSRNKLRHFYRMPMNYLTFYTFAISHPLKKVHKHANLMNKKEY